MDNELILDGIGTCRFCGQAVAVKPEPGETPDEAAVRACTMDKAENDFRLLNGRSVRGMGSSQLD